MGFKVLVVDDEKDLRDLLVLLLKKAGYETDVASSGNEAFLKIQHSRPDLVITDIRMPEGNGFELMRNVSHMPPPRVPMLFVSGHADGNEMELKNCPNFVGFMTKPVTWKDLIQTVKSVQNSEHISP